MLELRPGTVEHFHYRQVLGLWRWQAAGERFCKVYMYELVVARWLSTGDICIKTRHDV